MFFNEYLINPIDDLINPKSVVTQATNEIQKSIPTNTTLVTNNDNRTLNDNRIMNNITNNNVSTTNNTSSYNVINDYFTSNTTNETNNFLTTNTNYNTSNFNTSNYNSYATTNTTMNTTNVTNVIDDKKIDSILQNTAKVEQGNAKINSSIEDTQKMLKENTNALSQQNETIQKSLFSSVVNQQNFYQYVKDEFVTTKENYKNLNSSLVENTKSFQQELKGIQNMLTVSQQTKSTNNVTFVTEKSKENNINPLFFLPLILIFLK